MVGAHCTGKTTLAKRISDEYNIPIIDETARGVLRRNCWNLDDLRKDIDIVNEYQKQILEEQVAAERNAFAQNVTDFVADRAFDCMAYAAAHASNLYQLKHSSSWNWYKKWIQQNDVTIFFLRPNKEVFLNSEPDEERESIISKEIFFAGMERIDAMLEFLMEYESFKHISIHTNDFEKRVECVKYMVKEKETFV